MTTQTTTDHASENARAWLETITALYKALGHFDQKSDAEPVTVNGQTFADREAVENYIQESPLSVLVRSDWHVPGQNPPEPAEYEILLSGGPALRIIGDLDGESPRYARLEYQDWGTPWTEYITTGNDHAALMAFACQFFFS